MSNNSDSTGSFLAGFIIGGLVGAAASLILAPQSGREAREQLSRQGTRLRQSSTTHIQNVARIVTGDKEEDDTAQRFDEIGKRIHQNAEQLLDKDIKNASDSQDTSEAPE